jgi:Helix-turn-helix domain
MRSYSHLSEDERDQIGVLRGAGRSMGAIARALGRAKAQRVPPETADSHESRGLRRCFIHRRRALDREIKDTLMIK